jgi:hypothetical protein
VAVARRTTLLLPLDDLLAVVRELLNRYVSRPGLDSCMRRYGVGNAHGLTPRGAKPTHSLFKEYEPSYLHIDINYLPTMTGGVTSLLPSTGRRAGSLSASIQHKLPAMRAGPCATRYDRRPKVFL